MTHRLFLSVVWHKSHRFSLVFFILFSFCFSNCIISNDLFFCAYWFFLLLHTVCSWSSLLSSSVQSLHSFTPNFHFVFFKYAFQLFVELPILFLCYFLNFVILFTWCSVVALWTYSEHCFGFFTGEFLYLHFFGVSFWKCTVFFWWSHFSLILCQNPCWHPDLELLASGTLRNNFMLFMSYSVCAVLL